MLHKLEDGSFDINTALEALKSIYGCEEEETRSSSDGENKKRAIDVDDSDVIDGDENEPGNSNSTKSKKPKKSETVVVRFKKTCNHEKIFFSDFY